MTSDVICPYCQEPAKLVKGDAVYPHRQDLYVLNFWQCEPCDAYVGCHKPNPKFDFDGTEPLGRLADEELRHWKSQAHRSFDPLWREGDWSRKKAYKWLAAELKIDQQDCHIGEFDVPTCQQVVKLCNKRNQELAEAWLQGL